MEAEVTPLHQIDQSVDQIRAGNGIAESDVTFERDGGLVERFPKLLDGSRAATVVLTPFAAVDHPTAMPSLKAWGALIALGLFCTAAAFVFYGILVGEVGAWRALLITYVNPVVAVALGVAILGERPGAGAIAGLLLILAGSWLSTDGRLPPGLVALLERFDSRASPPDIGSVRELTAP